MGILEAAKDKYLDQDVAELAPTDDKNANELRYNTL
jgi:hypothetical protein